MKCYFVSEKIKKILIREQKFYPEMLSLARYPYYAKRPQCRKFSELRNRVKMGKGDCYSSFCHYCEAQGKLAKSEEFRHPHH
jgi:hypothetical protein